MKDRMDSVICGVTNKESLFNEKFEIPAMPVRFKSKVRLPSNQRNSLFDNISTPQSQLNSTSKGLVLTNQASAAKDTATNNKFMKGFQKKPTVESVYFEFLKSSNQDSSTKISSLIWTMQLTSPHSLTSNSATSSNAGNLSKFRMKDSFNKINMKEVYGDITELWKHQRQNNTFVQRLVEYHQQSYSSFTLKASLAITDDVNRSILPFSGQEGSSQARKQPYLFGVGHYHLIRRNRLQQLTRKLQSNGRREVDGSNKKASHAQSMSKDAVNDEMNFGDADRGDVDDFDI